MNPQELQYIEYIDIVLAKAGFGAMLLMLGCGLLIKLYMMERKDRIEAWKSHAELAKETNQVLKDLTNVLEVIKSDLHRR